MAENEFSELINAPHGKEQNIKMQLIDMIILVELLNI